MTFSVPTTPDTPNAMHDRPSSLYTYAPTNNDTHVNNTPILLSIPTHTSHQHRH